MTISVTEQVDGTNIVTMACPKCGKVLTLVPHAERARRLIGNCECNPAGPVLEVNAPEEKEEVKNDSNIG